MMKKYKQYLLTLLITFFVLITAHVLPLLIVDPLNLLKFDITENEFYIKEMRFQSAAIINKFEIDSAIVGTSMTQNFDVVEANKKLGGSFQNISLPGSLLNERKIVLEYLLAQKAIKTLIISIDGATDLQRNQGIPESSWSFLYNDSFLDDLVLYTNRKYSRYISCHSMFDNKWVEKVYGKCPRSKIRRNVEELTEWRSNPGYIRRFGGIENWLEQKDNRQVASSIYRIKLAREYIQKNELNQAAQSLVFYDPDVFTDNLLPLIKQNPDAHFILFFPPYSMLNFAVEVQTAPVMFTQYSNLVERVVLTAEQYPNVDVYWFAHMDFVKDIANYKDLTHYHSDYNSLFLDYFRKQKSTISSHNYKSLLDRLERDAQAIDITSIAQHFD